MTCTKHCSKSDMLVKLSLLMGISLTQMFKYFDEALFAGIVSMPVPRLIYGTLILVDTTVCILFMCKKIVVERHPFNDDYEIGRPQSIIHYQGG